MKRFLPVTLSFFFLFCALIVRAQSIAQPPSLSERQLLQASEGRLSLDEAKAYFLSVQEWINQDPANLASLDESEREFFANDDYSGYVSYIAKQKSNDSRAEPAEQVMTQEDFEALIRRMREEGSLTPEKQEELINQFARQKHAAENNASGK